MPSIGSQVYEVKVCCPIELKGLLPTKHSHVWKGKVPISEAKAPTSFVICYLLGEAEAVRLVMCDPSMNELWAT